MARPPRDADDGKLTRDGKVDPDNLDAARKGKRKRRKLRDRDDPHPELAAWKPSARRRAEARPFPPGVMLEPAGMDEEHWTSPHNDVDLWWLQLADAFGTRSMSVMDTFLNHLEALCGRNWWDEDAKQWRISEHEFSAAIAMVNGLKPRNEIEAAHAAQMVAIHLLTMKTTARALRYEHDTRTAAIASKLARTFTMQRQAFEGLRKPNRTARQSIKVSRESHHHQHIHIHRGGGENDGQPHATDGGELRSGTGIPAECPALPSPGQVNGEVVPFPGGEGEAGLPNARGRGRRAEG